MKNPWAIGPPNGPALARSMSTWIHWWSPVSSANWLTFSWVISNVGPQSPYSAFWASSLIASMSSNRIPMAATLVHRFGGTGLAGSR